MNAICHVLASMRRGGSHTCAAYEGITGMGPQNDHDSCDGSVFALALVCSDIVQELPSARKFTIKRKLETIFSCKTERPEGPDFDRGFRAIAQIVLVNAFHRFNGNENEYERTHWTDIAM